MATIYGLQEITQFLKQRAANAEVKSEGQALEWGKTKLRGVADKAISTWRSAYPPTMYEGGESLERYTIVEDGPQDISVMFEQQIASHQRKNDLVTELVVAQGYHGGSPGKEISGIRWRAPGPEYFNVWGRKAASSPSIISMINDEIGSINKQIKEKGRKLFAEYIL